MIHNGTKKNIYIYNWNSNEIKKKMQNKDCIK